MFKYFGSVRFFVEYRRRWRTYERLLNIDAFGSQKVKVSTVFFTLVLSKTIHKTHGPIFFLFRFNLWSFIPYLIIWNTFERSLFYVQIQKGNSKWQMQILRSFSGLPWFTLLFFCFFEYLEILLQALFIFFKCVGDFCERFHVTKAWFCWAQFWLYCHQLWLYRLCHPTNSAVLSTYLCRKKVNFVFFYLPIVFRPRHSL